MVVKVQKRGKNENEKGVHANIISTIVQHYIVHTV